MGDIMKIYNTLTKKKEDFIPLESGKVKIYVCGPTVYNLPHIGNARPMIVFDTVRRFFLYKGYEVNFVSNFTDIDDKIIKKAVEEGVDTAVISTRYIAECKKDMKDMNIMPATKHPLATEEIDGMKEMIGELIEKKCAYCGKDGTVYFRTKSFSEYGKLSHKDIDELQSGLRELKVTGEEDKEDSSDFVLWKPKKEGEPYWEAPWSLGRPGWHIECSVMSKKYLGEQIDIHGGGEDLIFPHHENEIAQSESVSGKEFARYWMHNAFLNIENKKMSKSLGNFFTIRDVAKKYDLQILRFFMLNAHYRSPLNFSEELMESAKNSLDRILIGFEKLMDILTQKKEQMDIGLDSESLQAAEVEYLQVLENHIKRFEEVMEDDFNTADAITVVFELIKLSNITAKKESSYIYLKELSDSIERLCDVLGIIVKRAKLSLDEEVEDLIAKRQEARKVRDFALADKIRNQLMEMGIILEDTREGVKWRKA